MYKYILSTAGLMAASFMLLAQKPIELKGRITAGKVDSIVVVNTTTASMEGQLPKYYKPDAQGNFSVKIPTVTRYNTIAVLNGNQRFDILGESGKTLKADFAFEGNPGVTFADPKESFSATVLERFNKEKGGLDRFQNDTRLLLNTGSGQYPAALDSLYDDYKKYIQTAAGSDKKLAAYLQEQLDLYKANALVMYAANQLNSRAGNLTPEQAQEYIAVSKKAANLVNDNYITYPVYQEYIVNYYLYGYIYEHLDQAGDLNKNIEGTLQRLKAIPQKKSAALGTARLLQMVQRNMDQKLWLAHANDFYTAFRNDPNAAVIKNMADDLQKFEKGRKAVDFEFVTLEGEKKKLSDYKGKVVYLDFWASWCGPCRQQMPFAREVKKHFEGKEVVFLYVSIDDSDEKWQNGIKNMSVEGVQTRSGGWGGAIPRLYNISSIPAYFLIDKNGNFAERPPRPSQKQELIRLIESLL